MAKAGNHNRDTRGSALWGSGNRGGERRSSALWGRGGRFGAAVLVAAFALCAPLAALADPGNGQSKLALVTARAASPRTSKQSTYVPPALLKQAQANGNQRLHVIIQATGGTSAAASAFAANGRGDGGTVSKRLSVINGVAVDLKAKWIMRLAKVPGLVVTVDAPVEATGSGSKLTNAQLWPYVSGNAKLWGSTLAARPQRPDDRDRRLRPRRDQERLHRARLPAGESQLDHPGRNRRRGRPRHLRRGNRGRRERRLCRRLPDLARPPDPRDGRQRRGAHVRRDRGRAVDPREQGHLQHQGRELLSPRGDRDALLLRPARPRGREALAERRRRRRGGRQLRHRRRPERRPLLARQRPVRDHGRRGRHRHRVRHAGRLGRPVVGLGPHRGRLRQAGARRARPVHDRARLERQPEVAAARSRRLARLHGALGHLVRRSGRGRRRRAAARAAPRLDARPGEGRAHAHRQAGRRDHEPGDRRRRGQRVPTRPRSPRRRTRTRRSTPSSPTIPAAASSSTRRPGSPR